MRVYELAKELGTTSKDLLAKLETLGIEVKNHVSVVSDEVVEQIKTGKAPEPPEAPAEAPEEKTPEEEAPEKEAPAEAEEKAVEAATKAPAKKGATKKAKTSKKETPEETPAEEATEAAIEETVSPAEPTTEESKEAKPEETEPEEAVAEVYKMSDNPTITLHSSPTVKNLALQLGVRPNRLVAELMRMNVLASINERVDLDTAKKIAIKHGFMLEVVKRAEVVRPVVKPIDELEEEEEDRPEDLEPRPPVVTFLGHVDHGKTSLLDQIRNAVVAKGESGGITQHIGAYTIERQGNRITFLDTPGHAAFTSMRARGANLTDIAVIIVAADDGVMPQTKEAIRHAKAAGVSIMVACNKIDLPGANVEQAKQQLLAEDLTPEDWGGDTIVIPVSAQTGEGIDTLLEMILLQAEVLELKANPKRMASGFVIESQLEQGMGPTAHLLVTKGTIKIGDIILCGQYWGRVRALVNDHGAKVKTSGPAIPVKCLGLSGVPEAGAQFRIVKNEKTARAVAGKEEQRLKDNTLLPTRQTSLDDFFSSIEEDKKLQLNAILKADTQGSVEAIRQSLEEIESDKVSLNLLLADTGSITVNDVMLASASSAVILGFHVGKEAKVPSTAKHEGVDVKLYQVIYELLDDIKEAMTGLLAPKKEERERGSAVIKAIFDMGKRNRVAGCMVTKGNVRPSYRARVVRGPDTLYEGAIASLKHFQDEVPEVRESQECGIRLDNYLDFAEGDILQFYEIEEVKQSL